MTRLLLPSQLAHLVLYRCPPLMVEMKMLRQNCLIRRPGKLVRRLWLFDGREADAGLLVLARVRQESESGAHTCVAGIALGMA